MVVKFQEFNHRGKHKEQRRLFLLEVSLLCFVMRRLKSFIHQIKRLVSFLSYNHFLHFIRVSSPAYYEDLMMIYIFNLCCMSVLILISSLWTDIFAVLKIGGIQQKNSSRHIRKML